MSRYEACLCWLSVAPMRVDVAQRSAAPIPRSGLLSGFIAAESEEETGDVKA